MGDARREKFEVGGRPGVNLDLPTGKAVFLAGEPGVVEVSVEGRHVDEFVIEQSGDGIFLRPPGGSRGRWDSFDLTVRMPPGGDVEVRAASADVESEVELGSLAITLASGDLRIGNVSDVVAVQSASGDVGLGEVGGSLAVNTASGDIKVRRAGCDAALNSASGDVRAGSVLGALAVSTQSGDVEISHYAGEDLECNSTSGDVRIGLPSGLSLDVDLNTLSGEIRSDFATESSTAPPSPPTPPAPTADPTARNDGTTARLRVKTVSGDISLVKTRQD